MNRCVGVLLFASITACYSYRPMTGVPVAGERVRVTLTEAGTTNLAAQVGPSMMVISGRVVQPPPAQTSADMYVIAVAETRTRSGREADWAGEQVSVARGFVDLVERRRFSRGRTVVASVALVATALAVREAFWGVGGAFGGSPPGGSPTPR